jgi:hypothetical protein
MMQRIVKEEFEFRPSYEEKLYIATIFSASLFWEYSKQDGFAAFSTIGGVNLLAQHYFFDQFWAATKGNFQTFISTLTALNHGVTSANIRPYVSEAAPPNVIAPLHLIAQSLCHEFVCTFSSNNLFSQDKLTLKMIEEALKLPPGLLESYPLPGSGKDNAFRKGLEYIKSKLGIHA